MTTALIFIFIPLLVSIVLYIFQNKTRLVISVGIALCIVFGLFALFQDFGSVLKIGPISVEIKTSMSVLGREFVLTNTDKFFLVFVYFSAAVWFGAAKISGVSTRFIPLGLAIIAILTSALAVEPFLYSAILVEIAVLISIPLMLQPGIKAGRGIIRFLLYQSLAMPLILFGGWLLGGIQASPSDTVRLLQSVLFLGIGFTIWLAIVPFHSWVPQLTEDIHPFICGFILAIFPIVTMLIMLDFISGLVWLRESQYLQPVLRLVGTIMVVSAGIWIGIEKKGRRLLGYAVLFEGGFALLAVSMQSEISVLSLFLSFIPRMVSLVVMGFSLTVLMQHGISLDFEGLSGQLRRYPFASMGLAISLVSMAGCPPFGGFPVRLAILKQLAEVDVAAVVWSLVGMVLFLITAIRIFMKISMPIFEGWKREESIGQVILLLIGILFLILMGLFPNLLVSRFETLFMNLPILR